jgi:hypothetical protein
LPLFAESQPRELECGDFLSARLPTASQTGIQLIIFCSRSDDVGLRAAALYFQEKGKVYCALGYSMKTSATSNYIWLENFIKEE